MRETLDRLLGALGGLPIDEKKGRRTGQEIQRARQRILPRRGAVIFAGLGYRHLWLASLFPQADGRKVCALPAIARRRRPV